MSISAITSSAKAGATANQKSAAEEAGNRFLSLLVAQLKNQDPLNPLDNAQITSQMAQVSTVQGIEKLNATMTSVLTQVQAMQATGMAGKTVLVDGNQLTVGGEEPARGAFELPDGARRVTVEVRDATGKVVATLPQADGKGIRNFSWDGTADGKAVPPGTYSFSVKAEVAGQSVAGRAYSADRITGVLPTANGVQFSTASGNIITMDAIRAIT